MNTEYKNFQTDRFFSDHCGKPLGKEGSQTLYRCPRTSNGKSRDFYVSPDGAWKCHHAKCSQSSACPVSGGGPFQFLSMVKPELSKKDAFSILDQYGRNAEGTSEPKRQDKPTTGKVWNSLQDIETWLTSQTPRGKGYKKVLVSEYKSSDGADCFAVLRCEPGKDKPKDFYQYHRISKGWVAGGLSDKRPLYRLSVVAARERGLPVIVCEGEKKADALSKALPFMSYWVTCPSQGAQSPLKTDWNQVKGRPVIIFPDNDGPGKSFAEKVSELCLKAGASVVSVVEPFYGKQDDDSRDIGDFLSEGGSVQTILDEIKSARVIGTTGKRASPQEQRIPDKNQKKTLKPITAEDLEKVEFPPIRWVVPDMLGEGYAILSGRPKRGKSWLALSLALAVASGGHVLGKIKVEAGDVLYIALEDTFRRIQTRLKILNDPEKPLPKRLFVVVDIPPVRDGGYDAIDSWLNDHPETRLVVVDTISHPKFVPPRGKNGDVFNEDYALGAFFQKMANRHKLCLLGLNHTKKSETEYAIDKVSGSTGITAACDSVLVLDTPKKGKADAELHVIGRDSGVKELALKFDSGTWSILGDAEDFVVTDREKAVIDLLRAKGPLLPRDIATQTGLPLNATHKLLCLMRQSGIITYENGPRTRYTLPNKQPSLPSIVEGSEGKVSDYDQKPETDLTFPTFPTFPGRSSENDDGELL